VQVAFGVEISTFFDQALDLNYLSEAMTGVVWGKGGMEASISFPKHGGLSILLLLCLLLIYCSWC
jgi:hypothetical protein